MSGKRTSALLVAALAAVVIGLPLMLLMGIRSDQAPQTAPDELNAGQVPAAYRSWVKKAGGICPRIGAPLIAAQIEAESGWDPTALNPMSHAAGLTQFIPGTWAEIGQDDDGNGQIKTSDAGDAMMAQGRYMCQLYSQVRSAVERGKLHGDPVDLALASYNTGLGNVLLAGGVPTNGETELYVPKILKAARTYTVDEDGPAGGSSSIIEAAKTQMGVPYVFAGGSISGPTKGTDPGVGYDCSGIIQYAVYQASNGRLELPHLARAQAQTGKPVPPAPSAMRPGDLIYFALGDRLGPGVISHAGIYLGHGKMLNAGRNNPSVAGSVRIDDITAPYWSSKTWTVRRLNLGR